MKSFFLSLVLVIAGSSAGARDLIDLDLMSSYAALETKYTGLVRAMNESMNSFPDRYFLEFPEEKEKTIQKITGTMLYLTYQANKEIQEFKIRNIQENIDQFILKNLNEQQEVLKAVNNSIYVNGFVVLKTGNSGRKNIAPHRLVIYGDKQIENLGIGVRQNNFSWQSFSNTMVQDSFRTIIRPGDVSQLESFLIK